MAFLKILDERLEEFLLVPSFVVSVVIVFMQVVMRYILGSALPWSEELARYLFVWQIWVGASYAVKKSRHIRVEFIMNFLSEKGKLKLEYLVLTIWICFSVLMLCLSIPLAQWMIRRGQLSPAMQIPMGYVYLCVPVGFSLMLLRLTQILYAMLFRKRKAI